MYQNIPLDENEQREAETAILMLQTALANYGYPEAVAKTLTLTFTKAAINPQDLPAGTQHRFADGAPFYRMALAAQGKGMEDVVKDDKDPSIVTLFYLVQALNISLTMGTPLRLTQDFRQPIVMRGMDVANAAVLVAPYVRKELGLKPG
ncbi:MAG: hypothetical protein KKA05_08805 [Alphaproteobacteria bacterium]|nr:hypothetical protein [Alphaproteobacteria bacterium]MBU0858372.1 hypothetical protein [Alphaproteobacteria bacterium]